MRTPRLSWVILAFTLAVAGLAAQPPTKGGEDVEGIKKIGDAYVKASLARDAKAIAALYTDDAIEMPPNQPMVKGRAANLQYYEQAFGGGMNVNSFALTHIDIHAAGDRGYDVGTYTQSVTPKGATNPVTDSGKYTVILKRVGSAWQVAYAIYNSDQPPPKG
jgi:ketosteroid isomerase-like protein